MHVSDSTTQVGQDHVDTGVLLVLGANTQPSEPNSPTQTAEHGLLPVLHRSDRWTVPVRPVTPVRLVDRASQDGGYSSGTTNVLECLGDSSRPWNKNTSKTQSTRKKNLPQSLAKQLQTSQELTSNNTTKRHTDQANHPRQIP
jgi:hypothetical protein